MVRDWRQSLPPGCVGRYTSLSGLLRSNLTIVLRMQSVNRNVCMPEMHTTKRPLFSGFYNLNSEQALMLDCSSSSAQYHYMRSPRGAIKGKTKHLSFFIHCLHVKLEKRESARCNSMSMANSELLPLLGLGLWPVRILRAVSVHTRLCTWDQ